MGFVNNSVQPLRFNRLLFMVLGLIPFLFSCQPLNTLSRQPTIKVGVLHSLTGTMAISEQSVVDATLFAIDEINQQGGLLGQQIEAVVVDGQSNPGQFARESERLITEEKVVAVFGGWTSASRKMMKPIFEKHQHLLFYPVHYEGLEQSDNIIYLGSLPNQQLSPTVKWSIKNLGKRVFLTASDYVYPHAANTLMTKQIEALGGTVVGESYIPLGSHELTSMIKKIADVQPDVILNTINGDSNLTFFEQLNELERFIPAVSFSISEAELMAFPAQVMQNHFAAASYFQSNKSQENQQFVQKFKAKYGQDRSINASMVQAYTGVYLWAQTVKKNKSANTTSTLKSLSGAYIRSPEGGVLIGQNNHTWKPVFIGKVNKNKQFDIVWSQEKPRRALPYPSYRAKESWHDYLSSLYQNWGNAWTAPQSKTNGGFQ